MQPAFIVQQTTKRCTSRRLYLHSKRSNNQRVAISKHRRPFWSTFEFIKKKKKKNPALTDKYKHSCMNIPQWIYLEQLSWHYKCMYVMSACVCVCVRAARLLCASFGDEWDFCVRFHSSEGIFEKHELWIRSRVQITTVMRPAEQLAGATYFKNLLPLWTCEHKRCSRCDSAKAGEDCRGKWGGCESITWLLLADGYKNVEIEI